MSKTIGKQLDLGEKQILALNVATRDNRFFETNYATIVRHPLIGLEVTVSTPAATLLPNEISMGTSESRINMPFDDDQVEIIHVKTIHEACEEAKHNGNSVVVDSQEFGSIDVWDYMPFDHST